MKKARWLSLFVMIVLCFTMVLSACSGNKSSTSESTKTPAPASESQATSQSPTPSMPEATSAKLDPYQLDIYAPSDDTNPKSQADVEKAIDDYLKDKINATVKFHWISWADYASKTSLVITSGQKIDVLLSASWNNFNKYVAQGYYLPMNDLIAKYGQGMTQVLDPVYLKHMKINGEIYGVPTNKEYASTQSILLSEPLVKQYGVDITKIKTLADLEPYLQQIHKTDPSIEGINMDVNGWFMLNAFFEQIGSDPFGSLDRSTTDYKIVDQFQEPAIVNMFKMLHKWYEAGYIRKDAATQQGGADMKSGKLFASVDLGKPGLADEFSVSSAPVKQVQADIAQPYTATSDLTGAMLSIAKPSKDPARAMMFINLLYTDPYLLNLVDWGVEGKDYTKVSDTTIKIPKDGSGWDHLIQWAFGDELKSYVTDNMDPDKWEQFKKFNKSSQISRIIGFNFDPTPVQTEKAALDTVLNQYKFGLITGTLDPDKYLPEMEAKMKDAGLEKYIGEKQKQLDAWLAQQKKD